MREIPIPFPFLISSPSFLYFPPLLSVPSPSRLDSLPSILISHPFPSSPHSAAAGSLISS